MLADAASLASVLLISGVVRREGSWIRVAAPPVPAPEATLRGAARCAAAACRSRVALHYGGFLCENAAAVATWLNARRRKLLATEAAAVLRRGVVPSPCLRLLGCDAGGRLSARVFCAALIGNELLHFSARPNAAAAAAALGLRGVRPVDVSSPHPELAAVVAVLRAQYGKRPPRCARWQASRMLAAPGTPGAPWPQVEQPRYASVAERIANKTP
jgi:hypothetical protein